MDQGQKPKIVKALLDGTNRTTIVSTGIVAPVDITIDRLTDDVYWADSIVDTIQVECNGSGVERNGSVIELRTLYYENPGSNAVLQC